jgi:hypothetical protein
MLVYQTFADTSLTDMTTLAKTVQDKQLMQQLSPSLAMDRWLEDPVSKQPLTHVLGEPLLQVGPGGPVLTVERHMAVIITGLSLATYFEYLGRKTLARFITGSVIGFTLLVRGIIYLLMDWK